MKFFTTLLIVSCLGYISCDEYNDNKSNQKNERGGNHTESDSTYMEVQYTDLSSEDFSFSTEWEYPEGIYINEYGQLSCDGMCPPEVYAMIENGRIIADSISRFYQLVDTTHQFVSLMGESNAYEYLDARFVDVHQKEDGTIVIESRTTVSTHSSINISVKEEKGSATIDFRSVSRAYGGVNTFHLSEGIIYVDSQALQNGRLQAKFDVTFHNHLEKDKPIYWRGLIDSPINKN